MSEQNGHTVEAQAVVLTAIVPANVRDVEFGIIATWKSPGGIQANRRPIPFQVGLTPDMILNAFVNLCNQGVIKKRSKDEAGEYLAAEDGGLILEPVGKESFALVPPETPAEPSRIVPL